MSLNKVKKAELQKMCEQKGFTTTGLVRADLLKLLNQDTEGGGPDHGDDQPGNGSNDG